MENRRSEEQVCLTELKTFIQGEEKLRDELFPDEFLLKFVRGKNLNSKAAFDTLLNYKTIRREEGKYGQFFKNYGPQTVRHVFQSGMIRILKHRDSQDRQILVMKTDCWDPSSISVNDVIMTILIICEEMLNSSLTQNNGIVVIRDYQGFGLSHMRLCTLNEIKKACNIFINSFPCKYKACHIIRNSYFFHLLLSMAKPFMPHKLKNRFFIHGMSMTSLHESVSAEILPEFLGGKLSEDDAWDLILEKTFLN